MVGSLGTYEHIVFAGARIRRPGLLRQGAKPLREFPSPSIFARSCAAGSAPAISPADRTLLQELFRRMQLNPDFYRATALARRIPACLRALQARGPGEALRRLDQDSSTGDTALHAILIGVTAFFRDTPVFSHLQRTAFPDLLRSAPAPKVLSVACSDGSELYSLAMGLLECGAQDLALRGIDCRRCALERAREGIYPAAALTGIPAALRDRYLISSPSGMQIRPSIRAKAHWHLADACLALPGGPYDVISCRNFAIYLEHAAAARLWRLVHRALKPGGLLITGKAERPATGFVRAGPCLFRKVGP